MKKIWFYLCLPLGLTGCCDNIAPENVPITIHWEAPSVLRSTKVQAVPLETDSAALIGHRTNYITHLSEYYIVGDDDKIVLFDQQGRIKTIIDARGRGPQEAYDMLHIAATDSTLLVADLGRRRMLEFGFDGMLRRAWPTERPFHNFTWFADALLLDNQTGMHHDDCVLPVCNAEGEIIRTPPIPIVGKQLNWPSAFCHTPQGCYYLPALQNDLYLIDRNHDAKIAYTFDFGRHGIDPEVCERYAKMENLFIEFDGYLRQNDKIAFVTFARTDKWLQLGFSIGKKRRYNWFCNLADKTQYLIPITAEGTSPWNHPVIGAKGDRFIVRVEAADYRRWPDCAVEGLDDDSNPVLLLCTPQES